MSNPEDQPHKRNPLNLRLRGFRLELLLGLAAKGGGAIAGFLMTLIVARGFGADVLGQYQLALATIMLLALVAVQGLDQLIVRNASTALARGEDGAALNFYRQARSRQVIVAMALALAVVLVADFTATELLGEPKIAQHLRVLAPAIIGLVLIRSCSAFLRAKGQVVVSQALIGLSYTTIAVLVLGSLIGFGFELPELAPSLAYLLGIAVAAATCFILMANATRGIVAQSARVALGTGLFIAGFSALASLNQWLGLFLLTAFRDSSEAGIYRVGFQICLLFTLVNGSFAAVAGPHLAKAFDQADAGSAWKTVRSSSMVGIAIVAPLLALIFFAAEQILWFFGPAFVGGADALRILAVGEFLNVAAGPAGAALTMMKHERSVFTIEVGTVALSVCVLLAMLPTYGMVAVATSVALAAGLRNAASLILLRRLLSKL